MTSHVLSSSNFINNDDDAPVISNKASRQLSNQVEAKHCWVCFANEDDDYSAQWASPCKCRGTAKWVHKSCLQRWIDEKQQGNSSIEVACPQCNSTYIIIYPKSGIFVRVLDTIDRIICKACPFLAGGILVGSVYWTAVTYGAVTIMQVLGHKEGLNVMEKADPLIMLIGLPTIPVMLMLGRMIKWEDTVLKFWRKHSTKLPLLNMIFPNSSNQYLPRTPAVSYSSSSDPISFTRTICGGLILPTIATIFGKLLFQRVKSNFQRSIIGGIAFITLKGILKIYYKQQQFLRQAHRQIKNYEYNNSSSNSSSLDQTSSSNLNNNTNGNQTEQTLYNLVNNRRSRNQNFNNATTSNANVSSNSNNYLSYSTREYVPTTSTINDNDSTQSRPIRKASIGHGKHSQLSSNTTAIVSSASISENTNDSSSTAANKSKAIPQSFQLNEDLQDDETKSEVNSSDESNESSSSSSFDSEMTNTTQANTTVNNDESLISYADSSLNNEDE